VLFKYVVHYADGERAEVPVLYGEGADHWLSKDPAGLKSAALAWAAPFPAQKSDEQAVVYQFTVSFRQRCAGRKKLRRGAIVASGGRFWG
jgi:hypothetical protein